MRTWIALLLTSPVALAACEDGPKQTFTTAPSGAAKLWNDGLTPGVTDQGAKQGFQADFGGGTNKQNICTGEQRAAKWAWMVKQPIIPPTIAAGLNGVGGEEWKGLTIEQAEDAKTGNCQSESLGDQFGDGSLVNQWGDNGEVWAKYNITNHKIEWFTLSMGYEGTMDFKSRDGKDTFQIHMGTVITKNQKPFNLDWNDDKAFGLAATELADALFATFAPELPAEKVGTNSCIESGHCTQTVFPDQGALRIHPLGLHLWVSNPTSAAQPIPSTFNRIDLRMPRVMPYTLGAPIMKLDAVGPTADIKGLPSGKDCTIQLGVTWKDFVDHCVNVTGDATKDKLPMNKLLGSITHDAEAYFFDTAGIDVDFQAVGLADTQVVLDADRPAQADKVVHLLIDEGTLGHFANDWSADGTAQDLHGSGAVYFEFARLVQSEINKQLKAKNPAAVTHELGDPNCLFPNPLPDGFDPKTFQYAENCTGFEGFVSAASPVSPTDADVNKNRLGPDAKYIIGSLGMKPGKPIVAFCMDATGDINAGYNYCGSADPYGAQGAMWDTAFQRVRMVLGQGNVALLPPEVRDRRFFFKQYVLALLKYLTVAGTPAEADLTNVQVDTNNLFFDSEGAGQYEFAEYVDRRFVTATQAPMDVTVKADILNGTLFDYDFTRGMYRDETAMYRVMLEKLTDAPGKENDVTLTNLFGSPVLAAAYSNHPNKTAYECGSADWHNLAEYQAIATDCEGQLPPLDPTYAPAYFVPDGANKDAPPSMPLRENGKPILTPYKGAFAGNATPFTLGTQGMKLLQTFPDLQAAQVEVAHTENPYDPTSKVVETLKVLVEPWVPMQPGVGFLWPVNGQQDKLVMAASMDFSGVTTSANVSYKLNDDQTMSLLAVETIDFLGDIFLCQDPVSGDLLRTKMYGSVATLVDWIASHPGSQDACGLIVRYSPYGNFPDYIISTTNGVRVGVTPGGGYGRVNDATLFVPGDY